MSSGNSSLPFNLLKDCSLLLTNFLLKMCQCYNNKNVILTWSLNQWRQIAGTNYLAVLLTSFYFLLNRSHTSPSCTSLILSLLSAIWIPTATCMYLWHLLLGFYYCLFNTKQQTTLVSLLKLYSVIPHPSSRVYSIRLWCATVSRSAH